MISLTVFIFNTATTIFLLSKLYSMSTVSLQFVKYFSTSVTPKVTESNSQINPLFSINSNEAKSRNFALGGDKLHPWWVTGFSDGEGSFSITAQPTPSELGHKIRFEFKVTQKAHSAGTLHDLQSYFGCGSVVIDNRKDDTLKFHVTSLTDIMDKVLPHFDKYPLVTSKRLNYLDFKKVAELKQNGVHLTKEGILAILEIKAGMNKGRSYVDKWNFLQSNTPMNLDPNWISAFIDGEGTFSVELAERGANTRKNTYVACYGELAIPQSSHDILVLNAIKEHFNSSGAKATLKPKYDITSLEEAMASTSVNRMRVRQHEFVIQLLEQYPLMTRKRLDYEDWKQIMSMYKAKLHLTPEGFNQMLNIKRGMNTGRNKSS